MSKNPDTVTVTITKCSECPHHRVGSSYSLDGFDRGNDWTCSKANRTIAQFVEWTEREITGVPHWCPLRGRK